MTNSTNETELKPAFDVPEDTPICDAFLLAEWGKHEADMTAPCEFYALDKHTMRIKMKHSFHIEYDKSTVTHEYECILTLPIHEGQIATITYHDEGECEGMVRTAYTNVPFGNILECAFESVWDLFNAVLKSEHQHIRENLKLSPYDK